MDERGLIGKVHSAVYCQCQQRGYAAPADVLVGNEKILLNREILDYFVIRIITLRLFLIGDKTEHLENVL
ncbi:MAG: hypothetical protein K2O40_06435 [Lachnospiraceae bacterium]|nr:hypothetical protein [Lachnospiraceae bacterium]